MGIGKHLVGIEGLTPEALRAVLERAVVLRDAPELSLDGRTVATLFFEDSTRTRVSFAVAGKKLGASVIDLAAKASSVTKGETLADTARTIEAMGVSALVVRAAEAGAPGVIARAVSCSVLNAGDGRHEHPTQALADALTIRDALGRDGFDFSGLRVGIVGDIISSRVARSNAWCLSALGAEVTLIGSEAMAPGTLADALPSAVARDLDGLLGELDVVMMLRIQFERGAGKLLASPREFRACFGLTAERAAMARPGTLVMHPGPMNRGVEIDDAVADGEIANVRPVIWDQVSAGVSVRMAALEACVGAFEAEAGGRAAPLGATVPS